MNTIQKEPIRVHVTISEDARVIFNWLLNYEAEFKGIPSAVAAALITEGAKSLYQKSLQEAEPLDFDVEQDLVEQSLDVIKKAG